MITRRRVLQSAGGAILAAPFLQRQALAQDAWPSREIHAICGTPPGSGADTIVRFYARKLQEISGRTIVVENKPGAFGNIATEYVSKSRPDGYTLFIAPSSSYLGASPSLFKKLAFDPVNDFEHVAPLLKNTWILAVAGDSPHKTAAELTAYLKAQGDKASYGSLANTGLVSSELYKANFGLTTVEVKYKETMGALNDLWAGNLAFIHIDPTGGGAHFKSGKLRPLATASAERLQSIGDIPSAREAGIMNSDVIGWWSVEMPKGTPKPALEKLEAWFAQITAADDTRAFLANVGCDPFPGSSAMLRETLVKEINAWKDYVKLAKIEPVS
jgi:tripartite-type tricarboxylate transporter receptor subunit TctC